MSMQAYRAIRGNAGTVCVKMNGNNYEIGAIVSFKATLEISNSEVKSVGATMVGHKQGMVSGSFEATLHFNVPIFRKYIENYVKTGNMGRLQFTVLNEDPTAWVGIQKTIIKDALLDSIPLAALDADSDIITDDISGTFDNFQIANQFYTRDDTVKKL